jgi:type I restriction enzyme S subunit
MNRLQQLLTDHIDIWTAADTEKKSGRGRNSGNAAIAHGIKKLRELILELAVRGKLVPQDPNDEPASELLKRIQAEKAKLIAEGKIKKSKPLPTVTEEEKPFDLPNGWEWVRLGEIASVIRGVTYGKSDASAKLLLGYVPLLRGNNIDKFLNFDSLVFVPKQLLNEEQYVKAGDIVIAMSSGSLNLVGKASQSINDFNGSFGAFCGVIRSASKEIFSFFGFFFQTPFYRLQAASHGKGIGINNLQKTALQILEVPLPPLAEQHRIVAKVDELMNLCDQLEAQHNNAIEAHEKLVNHLLNILTRSKNAEEFNNNWQRIAAHFDILFTTESSIEALKQTLLQLAVMGKLVRQDPKDEPASELLKRIQAEKSKLITEGKIKKNKLLRPITEQEKPFELPQDWEWTRVGNIGHDWGQKTPDSVFTYIEVSAIHSKSGLISSQVLVKPENAPSRARKLVRKGSIIYSTVRPYLLNIAVINHDFYPEPIASTAFAVVHPFFSMPSQYFFYYFRSPTFVNYVESVQTGIAYPAINDGQFFSGLIPLPPLSEQHRIVAKVDELMAICDQLKSRIVEANRLQQKLADVIVEKALSE